MTTITEQAAQRYAAAVHRVLVAEFPRLAGRTLELIVLEQVGRHVESPSRSLNLVVDDPSTAIWRLFADTAGPDQWRVKLACCKPRPSHANTAREQRVNTALRAIKLED